MNDRTMTLNLTEQEMTTLGVISERKGMSKTAIMRQALRLYELVDARLSSGERMFFSGDDKRLREFIGVL